MTDSRGIRRGGEGGDVTSRADRRRDVYVRWRGRRTMDAVQRKKARPYRRFPLLLSALLARVSNGDEETEATRSRWSLYDDLRLAAATPGGADRADLLEVSAPTGPDGAARAYDLRHLSSINPLVIGGVPDAVFVDSAAVAMLAVRHFNDGVSDVVPQIADVTASCPLKFTMDHFDTRFSPIEASRVLIDEILPRERGVGGGGGGGGHDPAWPLPTAILGAGRSAVSSPLAILSGVHGIPQVSYLSTSTVFDNRDQYPLFGRLVPSAAGDANAAVHYLRHRLGVTHLGVLHIRDEYGSTYAQAVQDAAGGIMEIVTSSFAYPATDDDIALAVRQLRASGLRYFFGIYFDSDYDRVMGEAVRQGIVGEGYFWMFGEALTNVAKKVYDPELDRGMIAATHGSALVAISWPSMRAGSPGLDAFLRHWGRMRSSDDARAYFESKMPPELTNSTGRGGGGSLLSDVPSPFSLLSYDTVIALAFSACDAVAKDRYFDGRMFYDSFLRCAFGGPHGAVAIDPHTGSRDYHTVPYSISNIVARPPDESGAVSFDLVTTDVFDCHKGNNETQWTGVSNFTYSDGTAAPPAVLPPVDKAVDSIGAGATAFGQALCFVSLTLSLSFGLWTFVNRRNAVVKASQPIFLGMLCLGSFLVGFAIVPMSVKEFSHSPFGKDVACMLAPWLFSFGFIVAFSGFFSKTILVNRIFNTRGHSRRVAVKVRDVMKPFILLFLANLAVLISWTVVSPMKYKHINRPSVDKFGRPNKCYVTCSPESYGPDDVAFIVLWGAINFSALLYANYEAYRGRYRHYITTEYSESEYIGISMGILLQAFVIGTPVLIIVEDMPTARFMIRCCLVFVTVVAVLVPIFVPKIIFLRRWRAHEKRMERKLILALKKERQMDALAIGDISASSWYLHRVERARSNGGSSPPTHDREGDVDVGLRIIAKHDSWGGQMSAVDSEHVRPIMGVWLESGHRRSDEGPGQDSNRHSQSDGGAARRRSSRDPRHESSHRRIIRLLRHDSCHWRFSENNTGDRPHKHLREGS